MIITCILYVSLGDAGLSYKVYVTNSTQSGSSKVLCGTYSSSVPTAYVTCNQPLLGRIIFIRLDGTGEFSACAVEATGYRYQGNNSFK